MQWNHDFVHFKNIFGFPKMWGFLIILAQMGIFNQNRLVILKKIHPSKITAENGLIF